MKKTLLFILSFLIVFNLSSEENCPHFIQELVHENMDSCTLVLFGATGDLAARKLYPAIYRLALEKRLPQQMAIVGTGRTAHDNLSFRDLVKKAIQANVKELDTAAWSFLEDRLFYHAFSVDDAQGYQSMGILLNRLDQQLDIPGNRLYYLATQPSLFETIIANLYSNDLISRPDDPSRWTRVLIEKPFGFDLASATQLQASLTRYLDESQLYRIDHYLAKEGVQHLLSLRFEQKTFESIWNSQYIEQVQISFSEELGVGSRANFWEETGALRDFFQNHLMQLVAIIAMEMPETMTAENIIAEKVKVLESIRPFPLDDLESHIVRGQYGPGTINGKPVPGYRNEVGVPDSSSIETFVAAKLWIDNNKWMGIPFYIRGGKRMPKQSLDIAIVFKTSILHIRIQPEIIVAFESNKILSQIPTREAYQNILYAGIMGNRALFVHIEEQLAAWRLFTPVLQAWKENIPQDFPNYDSGSWGPKAADELLILQNHKWEL